MKKNLKTITKIGAFVVASMALGSCKDFMNPETGTNLLETDNYKRSAQVKANFIGVAASFQQISDHWIILSELRGDLVQPTLNAPTEFWNVHNYRVDSENFLADPSVYYRAIINCNDFVRHAVAYDQRYPGVVAGDLMKGMIADALRFRAWAYFTLGRIYGEVIYYDLALVDDVNVLQDPDDWKSDMDSIYFNTPPFDPDVHGDERPEGAAIRMPLDRLIEELIDHLHTGVEGYDGLATFVWTDLTNNTDASWNRLSINPNALLGDLYMWKAAFNPAQEFSLYQTALGYLIQIPNNSGALNTFTLANTATSGSWTSLDLMAIFNNSTTPVTKEIVSMMPFNLAQQQTNNLNNYFVGSYFMSPTNVISEMYSNTPRPGGLGDSKRGNVYVTSILGYPVVTKYSLTGNNDNPIIIYRAGEIHLMIAECLNHLTMYDEACAFFGEGVGKHWQSGGFYKFPFSNPLFSSNLRIGSGVRGRAGLSQYGIVWTSGNENDQDDPDLPEQGDGVHKKSEANDVVIFNHIGKSAADKKFFIDSLIAKEVAMECSFEGKRYFTLLRHSIFWDDTDYFARRISAKFEDSNTMMVLLKDRKNWFINYKLTELY